MPSNESEFRVLVVDDEELYCRAIGRELVRQGMTCELAFSGREAVETAGAGRFDVILLDHRLPDDDGIRLIPVLLGRQPSAVLFMMTAYEALQSAIQAIRLGAEDYLVKETRLAPIVEAVCEARRRKSSELAALAESEANGGSGLLGTSPAIQRVREQIRRVSRRRETVVLFLGETGSGKEVAARALHASSAPTGSPFVAVDCTALPATLIESLLFGHEKGAFTGADRTRPGAFEEAGEGTIFLDEIGELDAMLQGKLLRVLESRTYQRIGSVREYPVRARIVAATNRDLRQAVAGGAFRFDLYQRLSVFPISVPPLRERGEDVLILARHFVSYFAERMGIRLKPLSREVEELFLAYGFPGNVRELKNVIERAAILTDSGAIEPRFLPERILRRDLEPGGTTPAGSMAIQFVPGRDTLESLERTMILRALEQSRGVKSEAARLLGISRFQLLRRLEKFGIEMESD